LKESIDKGFHVLKEAGFEKITNPLLRKTLGRAITIKKACEEQRIDLNSLKEKIEMIIRS